jgi:hypothetical protein
MNTIPPTIVQLTAAAVCNRRPYDDGVMKMCACKVEDFSAGTWLEPSKRTYETWRRNVNEQHDN